MIHPDDVPRFAELGVAANAQALWACHEPQMDELTIPFLGDERATWQYPFGELHRAGARLVMGSDWPVTSPDPLAAIHTAVTRTAYDDPREPFLPEQALDLTTAFAAYTSGSAWINGRDLTRRRRRARAGPRRRPGVLDRDPFAAPADEIGGREGGLDVGRRCGGLAGMTAESSVNRRWPASPGSRHPSARMGAVPADHRTESVDGGRLGTVESASASV